MKMRFRLTALLLAVMTLLTTAAPALATTLDLATYQQMLDRSAGGSEPIITEGGQVYTMDNTAAPAASGYDSTTTVQLAANAAGSETEQSVTLPYYGKVVLASAIGNGQWQVQVGDQWVNMHGETASTLEVTLAKVQSLFEMNDCAKLRHAAADGSAISNVASIELSYNEQASVAPLLQATVRNAVAPLAEGEGEEDPLMYSIVVNYIFNDGSEAATASSAIIGKGQALEKAFEVPYVQGYSATQPEHTGVTAFAAPTNGTPGSITLSFANVQGNETINVIYQPDFVNVTFEHWQMGFAAELDNDTDNQKVTGQSYSDKLKTGQKISELDEELRAKWFEKEYPGFRRLWFDENTAVAADGSTVIKIYYEREWHLMKFELDGGYGTDPLYMQYGADIGTVPAPTKAGYTFVGWAESKGGEKVDLPETMPAEDKTYYAIWQVGETAKVTVVFWGENADDEKYSYLSEETTVIDLVPGTQFTYSEGEMLTCKKKVHTHTDACLECGKTEHTHSEVGGSCYTLTCTTESHTHGTGCYAGVGSQQNVYIYTGLPDNPSDGQICDHWLYDKLIYIKGSWYKYTGSTASGSIAPTTCGKQEATHTHGDSCYTLTCATEVHAHNDSCNKCSQEAHTHNSDCYMQGAGLDTTKWKFVKSDTITVAADGSSVVNVYYDRVEYSVQFYNGSGSTEYTDIRITAKWGAYIGDKWPTRNNSGTWAVNPSDKNDVNGPYQVYLQEMPVGGDKFYGPKTDDGTQSAYYYVEVLPGETGTETYNNKSYKLHHTDTSPGSGYVVTDDDKYAIQGFTYVGFTANINNSNKYYYNNAKFFYTRNSYKLTFNDQYNDVKTETVKFEAPLSTYKDYVPEVPSQIEPGSVEFGGWYQNPQCTGEEYMLANHNMPANDIILYAKWVPVKHKVTLYKNEDAMKAGTKLLETFEVPHGSTAQVSTDDNALPEGMFPTDTCMNNIGNGLTFVAWFYKDADNNEVAFDPKNTPVRKDLELYAKWTSNNPVTYVVHYVLAEYDENEKLVVKTDENGATIKVAADTEGKGMYGRTYTVDAKTDKELYEAYQTGYFPVPPSHSVVLEAANEGEMATEYTFLYVKATEVPYRVRYLAVDENGTPLDDQSAMPESKLVENNTSTVVTENYVRVPGWMPDASQKRLILTYPGTTDDDGNYKTDPEKGENIIFFYYKRDTVNAYYTVTHYTQSVDGKSWIQYGETASYSGKIGTKYKADPLNLSGYTFAPQMTVAILYDADGQQLGEEAIAKDNNSNVALQQTLPAGGMDFKLYYTRNKYPVKVRYLEETTNYVLLPDELFTQTKEGETVNTFFYQDRISVPAKAIHGYTLVSNQTQIHDIIIDADVSYDENGVPNVESITKNVVTFYYKKTEVEIKYVAVAPDGHQITTDEEKKSIGYVTSEAESGDANGKVTALDGPVRGSTATAASSTYKFVGWYTDKECTQQVPDSWLDSNKMIPQKEDSDGDPATKDMLYKSATYYAKFEYNITTLTIEKAGVDETKDPDASFVFHVKGKDVDLDVVINGNGSVTINGLTVGETYTVTETAGNWRYTPDDKSKNITLEVSGNEVIFTNSRKHDNWLDGDCYIENVFKGVSNQ